MSLWGTKDSVYADGTIADNFSTLKVVGTGTTFNTAGLIKAGDIITCGAGQTYGEADITAVFFEESTYAASATGTVVVIYNEQVDVTNGATLVVTNTTDSASITATAAAQTGTNRVEFTFTCAAASKVHTIGAQTISGTIVDAGTSTASDKVFVLGDTIGAGGSGSTKTITTT